MAQNRQPRKSVFSADAHPLKSLDPAPQATEGTLEAPEAEKAPQTHPAKPRGSEGASEQSPRVKSSFYVDSNSLSRMREAYTRTKLDEGYESFSDFIFKAALKETRRLEKKHNDGQPYEGIQKLSAGRPIRL